MLFTEFAQNLGFDQDIAQAKLLGKNFPLVGNVGERFMRKIRSSLNAVFTGSDISCRNAAFINSDICRRLQELCSLERMPTDLSYYLVDSISVRGCNREVEVCWSSRIGEEDVEIAVFQLKTKKVSLCGQDLVFVEGAEFIRGLSDSMEDAVFAVIEKQNATGRDLFERWCCASDEWRETHLICPACGAPIDPYSVPGGLRKAECCECGWESKKKYYYSSDFADVTAMKAELKQYKKKLQRNKMHDDLFQEMITKINTFVLAATHDSPRNDTFYRYRQSIREAIGALEKAESEMDKKAAKK